jgi:hypothetical protein
MRGTLLTLFIRLARRPRLGPAVVDEPTAAQYAALADALLAGESVPLPRDRLDFLRWLAAERDVVFHGSPRADLTELSTERKSQDASEFGNQHAVYATTDPVWAIYFACLRRDNGFRGTRNASLGSAGGPLYPRSYFFVHNRGSQSSERFGPGSLYLLPPETFEAEAPMAGVVDTAHLISRTPVSPFARVDVTPADFPFRDRIGYFRDREPIFVSLLRG